MDYRDYISFLNEKLSPVTEHYQNLFLNSIKNKDQWMEIAKLFKGWALNMDTGILIFKLETESEGKLYHQWDNWIRGEIDLKPGWEEEFELLGDFKLPPEFKITLKPKDK